MIAAMVSHFADAYFERLHMQMHTSALWRLGMIASPTFLIISGCMLALLYETHRSDFGRIRRSYLDRGIFLLTLGRLLIALAHVPLVGLGKIVDLGFVTDAIAFSFIVSVLLIDKVGARGRLLLGASLYGAAWLVIQTWHPGEGLAGTFKEFVIGRATALDPQVFVDDFPLAPWLGIYLCGTALGHFLVQARAEGGLGAVRDVVGRVIVGMALLEAALAAAGFAYARGLAGTTHAFPQALSPFQKLPPGPIYALGYGGLGLAVLWIFLGLEERSKGDRLLSVLGVFGRASLFVFILQYYVFFTLFKLLRLPYSPWWPLWLGAAIVAIWFVAREWDRRNLNRLLTVGLATKAGGRTPVGRATA